MGSVVFVHGTSVREESFKKSLSKVGEKLPALRVDLTHIPCFWGEKFGSTTIVKLRSIPTEGSSLSPERLHEEDHATGVWGLVCEDPFSELGVLCLGPKQTAAGAPNQLGAYQQL